MGSPRLLFISTLILTLIAASSACDSERGDAEMPAMLRRRFEAEMKTILRDLRLAEEQAMALEGRYLEFDELRSRYFSRDVPDSYVLTLAAVSAEGFRAEIVHGSSGLRCRLEVGSATPSGAGSPRCD